MANSIDNNSDSENDSEKTFLNNIMRSFIIVVLTIGLIYIRNWMADNAFFQQNKLLTYLIFCFIVIIFMFLMSSIQGSSFISLMTIIVILVAITMLIWFSAGAARN